jgi:N-acetylglutamate synthase-like GNAT family acetyltransferase
MLNVIIRAARNEDAAILAAAERATAETPGLLVSRPYELIPKNFEKKIAELAKIGRYVVAEKAEKIVGHALLDPMPLEALSHVFRLTIVVHPGFRSQGVGEFVDDIAMACFPKREHNQE